ncbi:MAG: hypothetical protein ACKVOW_13280 [Chitinophagaceae bacterium]
MNIENISELTKQLKALGFSDAVNSLVKKICFCPQSFCIIQKNENMEEQISFQLFFERKDKEDVYALMYYDATLQKDVSFGTTTISGINIEDVEKKMAAIDWKKAFDFTENKNWNASDKSSWETEEKIETIMTSLTTIETTEEGKSIAAIFKLKYWTGSAYFELFENINQAKSKAEISQRFYCSEGQPGISVDEAYRFLQNRKMEKQLQARKKQADNQNEDEHPESKNGSSGSGLLKKRRINNSAKGKKNKPAIQ